MNALSAGGLIAVVCVGSVILLRWLARTYSTDKKIDGLIKNNKARPRDGMETIDWRKSSRAGEDRWMETIRAQQRYPDRKTPITFVNKRRSSQ